MSCLFPGSIPPEIKVVNINQFRKGRKGWDILEEYRAVRPQLLGSYSNSPAPPKCLLNVIGEQPIQYNEAHWRNGDVNLLKSPANRLLMFAGKLTSPATKNLFFTDSLEYFQPYHVI